MKKAKTSKGAKERIIEAATAEFVSFGFAGARLARIAKRAKVSSQLLYHYFSSKKGLYAAIMEHFHSLGPFPGDLPENPDAIVPWFQKLRKEPNAVMARLSLWETLENKTGRYVAAVPRRQFVSSAIEAFRRLQEKGYLSAAFDPLLLFMTFCAVTQAQSIYKQIPTSVGIDPESPEFRARWLDHFVLVARALGGDGNLEVRQPPKTAFLSMPPALRSQQEKQSFSLEEVREIFDQLVSHVGAKESDKTQR